MNSKELANQYIKKNLSRFPFYVAEFMDHMDSKSLAETTKRSYLADYDLFFTWIVENGYSAADKIKDVTIAELNSLRLDTVDDGFLNFVKKETPNHQNIDRKGNLVSSQNHKITSLKSLFYFLSTLTEDSETLEPYLARNVMSKIPLKKDKNDDETAKADLIRSSILLGDKGFKEFRDFVGGGYEAKLNTTISVTRYNQNKERDLAIISLILSNGLRIEEVANLRIQDISLEEKTVNVIRKGGKKRIMYFGNAAKRDLENYLAIRKSRFNTPKEEHALFVTLRNQIGVSMAKRSMQAMIVKYAKAFGKINLTAHSLRHSFATRYYAKTKDLAKLQKVMDHDSITTTMIYTHVLDESIQKSINQVDDSTDYDIEVE